MNYFRLSKGTASLMLLTRNDFASDNELNLKLLKATQDGQTTKVLELLKIGADQDAKPERGETVLIIASSGQYAYGPRLAQSRR